LFILTEVILRSRWLRMLSNLHWMQNRVMVATRAQVWDI